MRLPCPNFREDAAHRLCQYIHELIEKGLLESQRAPVFHGTAQYAAQHIVAVAVSWLYPIGNREAQRADMVGNHAEGHVYFFLLSVPAGACLGQRAAIGFPA